jgi:Na+/melibiose symporter-like transporter
MGFFNSLSIRIPLAIIGGILYSALTYTIVALLDLSSEWAIFAAIIVFLFYLGSRLLILFSGIDSPYYSKGRKEDSKSPFENTAFYFTTQWVGKFYHPHDTILLIFLVLFAISFLISLGVDWWSEMPFGRTAQNLWNSLIPMP